MFPQEKVLQLFVMVATAKEITVKSLHAATNTKAKKAKGKNVLSHFKFDGITLDIISTFFIERDSLTIVE